VQLLPTIPQTLLTSTQAACYLLELLALALAFRHDNAASYISHKAKPPPTDTDPDQPKYNPLRSKLPWLCALYWFAYCGMESCYGDWIVTYMISVRHVEREVAARAASVFWSGMCIGRFTLSPITQYVGIRSAVLGYILISLAAQATLRCVENTTTFFIVLALIGAFFGPIFPSGVVLLGQKLPLEFHVQAVSAAAALGQSGGATAPLLVGYIADAFGIGRLLDVVIVFTVVLIGLWILFCRSAVD
jgi:fucose permease